VRLSSGGILLWVPENAGSSMSLRDRRSTSLVAGTMMAVPCEDEDLEMEKGLSYVL